MDTNAIAVISLILVILVIVYLILGRIIKYRWPDSKANRFFGGTRATRGDLIAAKLRTYHDIANGDMIDPNNEVLLPDTLHNYLQYLYQSSESNTLYRRDVMHAIAQILSEPTIDYNYKTTIIDESNVIGFFGTQTDTAERLRAIIANNRDTPEETIRRNITDILGAHIPRVGRTDADPYALRRT